eukprot:5129252-Pyramimonas_sp.AAC.1
MDHAGGGAQPGPRQHWPFQQAVQRTWLQELKRATTARYAAKVSWKKLCLSARGGSGDKLKNFLLEKSDSLLDNVKALARSLLVLINLIERRCTVA